MTDHIEATKAAMLRTKAAMAELEAPFDFPANCCPGCACGPEWHVLADKFERQAEALRGMLKRRGRPQDLRFAEAVRISAWP